MRSWRAVGLRETLGLDRLDRKLARRIKLKNGFFIEAGANDGIAQSNTLYFEAQRGWSGLLVEPIPALAEQCRRNRPASIVENCALGAFAARGTHVEMRYCNLMSVVKGAMKSPREEEQHIADGVECQLIRPYDLTVPVFPLSDLLDRHGVTHVDLFSLDVEGYELPVLQGLDLNRHRPTWLVIEARYRQEIDEYLAQYYDTVEELGKLDVLYRAKTWKLLAGRFSTERESDLDALEAFQRGRESISPSREEEIQTAGHGETDSRPPARAI